MIKFCTKNIYVGNDVMSNYLVEGTGSEMLKLKYFIKVYKGI